MIAVQLPVIARHCATVMLPAVVSQLPAIAPQLPVVHAVFVPIPAQLPMIPMPLSGWSRDLSGRRHGQGQ